MLIQYSELYFQDYLANDRYPSRLSNSDFLLQYKNELNRIDQDQSFCNQFTKLLDDSESKWFLFNLLGVMDDLDDDLLIPILNAVVELQSNLSLITPIMFSVTRIFGFLRVENSLLDFHADCKAIVRKSSLNVVLFENRPPLDLNWSNSGNLVPDDIYSYSWTGSYYKTDMHVFEEKKHSLMVKNIESVIKKRNYMIGSSLLNTNYSGEHKYYLLNVLPANIKKYEILDEDSVRIVKEIVSLKKNPVW